MVVATTTWHKPPLARHAAVYEALADILEGATPSAVKLALYLYRTCIGGKPEEIDINCIPLGEKRATPVRNGKPYSSNTRRAALKQLEKLGLVKILKNYGRGIFRLAVQHLGDVRPFTHTHSKFQKLSNQSKNQRQQSKIEQTEGSNPDGAVVFTKDKKEQQSTKNAAVFFDSFKERENLAKTNVEPKNVEPKPTTEIQTKNSQLNNDSRQKLKTLTEDKYSAPTPEYMNNNSDKNQASDATIPCSSEQTGLTSKSPQKLPTKLNSLDHQRISDAEPTISTNKAVQLNLETSSFVNPQVANPQVAEIVEAVAIANSEATEIVEAVVIANSEATEIIEAVAIVNSETTEIAETVAIANSEAVGITNPAATEIVEIVMQATGGMNPELRVCVLQYNLEEIQAAINLLQLRSETKQISNPSGWVVDCLRGRWWEQTNGFPNSNPTNVISSSASRGSSPIPKNSPSAQTTRITEDYIDPQYMPLKTHQKLSKQFQELGEETFASLGIQQQIYLQWMQRFPQQAKQIFNKLSTT
ncbi:hypothetical protein [Microcoleus sp. PH2017_30_WIL_O_A]|uniref:hypothetical protein n=1 Tax=Microcoleus sp. PH2017_30_WIL_O_A TaxID=2798840 RepID=UPI001DF61CA5|nr:hypothetical protein [Microcoleus sp. PH2017_30_WIL_O_A]MCC3588890.1 hypothetical protein [Microcoleus sp. PH2017_30_WIL_O_A]